MIQSFTVKKLLQLCKHDEWIEWGITQLQLTEELKKDISEIYSNSFVLKTRCEGDVYIANSLSHTLILRKLNDDIRRVYKVRQSNRRMIIKQVKSLLLETCPSYILRTDIKGFYESIEPARILEKLKDDCILSYHSIELLDKILSSIGGSGLPRGLSISASLSELYMRSFDRIIQRIDGVYYYARFVDDILLFAVNHKITNDILQISTEILSRELNLELNTEKTHIYNGNEITTKPLDYLGYKFNTKLMIVKSKPTADLKISIADKKVKKIKYRIIKVFVDYIRNSNFSLMSDRMKLLTGNYTIRSRENGGELKAGIFYNYNYLNDYSVLDELDVFYNKLIYSKKGSIGSKLYAKLTATQRLKLSRYSFKFGWQSKIHNTFKKEDLKKIKRCWYE